MEEVQQSSGRWGTLDQWVVVDGEAADAVAAAGRTSDPDAAAACMVVVAEKRQSREEEGVHFDSVAAQGAEPPHSCMIDH